MHSVPTGRSASHDGVALSWHQFVLFGNTCFAQRWEETGEGRDETGHLYLHTQRRSFFYADLEEVDPENLKRNLKNLYFSV